jgi:hypothetical protein
MDSKPKKVSLKLLTKEKPSKPNEKLYIEASRPRIGPYGTYPDGVLKGESNYHSHASDDEVSDDTGTDYKGTDLDAHIRAKAVADFKFDNSQDLDDFDNSQRSLRDFPELQQIITPSKDYNAIAGWIKKRLDELSSAPLAEKSSGKDFVLTWNPNVILAEYQVDHDRPFKPTNNELPQGERMEKLAEEVSKCLLKGIQYEPLVVTSPDVVVSAVEDSFEKANIIQPGRSMTAFREEDICKYYFSKNNLQLLDTWYYDAVNKISYLDYAVELTVKKYIELNNSIVYKIDYLIRFLWTKCKELMGTMSAVASKGGKTKKQGKTKTKGKRRSSIKRSIKRSKKRRTTSKLSKRRRS